VLLALDADDTGSWSGSATGGNLSEGESVNTTEWKAETRLKRKRRREWRTFNSHFPCTAMVHFPHLNPFPHTLPSHTAQILGVTNEWDLKSWGLKEVEASSPRVESMRATSEERRVEEKARAERECVVE
jgi:hypothetical protein